MNKDILTYSDKTHCVGKSSREEATCSCKNQQPTQHHSTADEASNKDSNVSGALFFCEKAKQEVFVISRVIYYKAIEDKQLLKALAFALAFRSHITCGTARHPNNRQLALRLGMSEYAVKRAIETLKRHGLCEYTDSGNLALKSLKYRKNNIYLKGINTDDYKSAYIGLHTAAICDEIQKAEYVRQQLITKERPARRPSKTQRRRFKQAATFCKLQGARSLSGFSQNGYSYDHICKKYHFSKREVSAAVKYGVKHKMFSAKRTLCVLGSYDNKNVAITALDVMRDCAETKRITQDLNAKLQKLRGKFNNGFIQLYHNLGEKLKRSFVRYNEKEKKYQIVFNSTNLYILNYKKHTLGGRTLCSDIITVPFSF